MNLGIPRQREKPPLPKQVVVKAIIFDENGRILLLRKPKSEWRKATNGYDLPGGKLEKRDRGDVDEALRREVREETGLNIRRLTVNPISIEKEEQVERGRTLYIERYLCVIESPKRGVKVDLSEEHDDFGWVTPEQLRTIKKSTNVNWLFINRENIGCPSNKTVKDWIDYWKDVPDQMVEYLEGALRLWIQIKDRERAQSGRER